MPKLTVTDVMTAAVSLEETNRANRWFEALPSSERKRIKGELSAMRPKQNVGNGVARYWKALLNKQETIS